MARDYFACKFALDGVTRYLLWYSDRIDGVDIDANGYVPVYSQAADLVEFATTRRIMVRRETMALHDLDSIQRFIVGELYVDCEQLLSAWNLFTDIANSTGEKGLSFGRLDKLNNEIYDKLFWGNNLPAVTPEGEKFSPKWKLEEIEELVEVSKVGMAMFREVIRPA